MRIASWLVVASMLLGMIAMFVPGLEVEVHGTAVGHRATLSLYKAESNREVVRRWLASYGKSSGKRIGGAILPVLLPHTHGAVNDHLDDVSSAMDTLEDVHDDDVRTAATVLTALLWGFLALQALALLLVLRGLIRGAHHGRALAGATLLALAIAAVGVGLYLGWGAAAFEINDEIGHEVVQLAAGAYLSPLAGLAGLAGTLALVVLHVRARRSAR